MRVAAITCTKNRHTCLERVVKMFLAQTYTDSVQIIYNNSCTTQRLNKNIPNDRVILINNCLSLKTNKPYTTLGEIYTDAITYVPEDCSVICFMDDDDCYLQNHIEEGVNGLIRGGKTAYKPELSYFRSSGHTRLVGNNMEPSIFIKKEHILQYGFSEETTAQHMQWLRPLYHNNDIFIDPKGPPTLIYTWGEDIPVFKTSGDPNNPKNFNNYEAFSQDIGDQIITPMSDSLINKYYSITK